MTSYLNFKALIDRPEWLPLPSQPATDSGGSSFASDLRNDSSRNPLIWQLKGAGPIYVFDPLADEWLQLGSPALGSGIPSNGNVIFVPSAGPNGTLTTGSTTTAVNISTALPSAVGINQLANRGDGQLGFKIRIIGNSSGGSGKVEERFIVGNSSGTTPTIQLSSALSFTPASGDHYEILSGRVFCLGGSSPVWKYFDVATNSFSGTLTTTNLTTPSSATQMVVLDEQYVPSTLAPGQGFLGSLTATNSSSTTLTGQSAGGDAGVASNEYRNFQIRIIQDTGTPTAVGQRRRITSHTAGASPVYTVPTWTVTPSTTAQFVIEGNGDVLLWEGASTTTFSYAAGAFAADAAWSTTGSAGGAGQYASRGSAPTAGGVAAWGFGITLDSGKNARYSMIYSFRGGASTLDVFDISAAAQGTWSNAVTYGMSNPTFNTGSCAVYDPVTNSGKWMYINKDATQDFYRFDLANRVLQPWAKNRFPAAASAGNDSGKLAFTAFIDSSSKLGCLYFARANGNAEFFGCFAVVP